MLLVFCFFYRTPIIEKWFHAAGVWDRRNEMAYLYLDGLKVGSERVPSSLYPTDHNYSFFDIGLKRDANHTMKGYLRDLMIIKAALTGEEILNITGTTSFYNCDVSPRLTTNPLGDNHIKVTGMIGMIFRELRLPLAKTNKYQGSFRINGAVPIIPCPLILDLRQTLKLRDSGAFSQLRGLTSDFNSPPPRLKTLFF